MKHTAAEGLWSYWKSPEERVQVNPAPPKRKEAKPFHVVVRGDGWIPISHLVFARDAEHAEGRIRMALVECCEGAKHHFSDFGPPIFGRILRELETGELTLTVEPYDVTRLCAKVNWASNGGL